MWEAKWEEQARMLGNRLQKKQRHLRKWARRNKVSCYRVYHLDIPELPFSIDWYGDKLHISEWRRNHPHPPEQHPLWQEWMLEAICDALHVDREDMYLKLRERQKGKKQYEKVAQEQERMVVEESGHQFYVNLTDYLDTGLFLDHRTTRQMVEQEAAGKKMLNLFCYTGAFTVYAAAGGATHTTSVDLSKTYLHWAQDNLVLNDLAGRHHRVIHSDVLAYLRDPVRERERYDIIVLDPPTVSKSKRMEGDFDIQRDYPFMVDRCLSMLSAGGHLYFSNNFRGFVFDEAVFAKASTWEEITHKTIPEDFRNSNIHRCWLATR